MMTTFTNYILRPTRYQSTITVQIIVLFIAACLTACSQEQTNETKPEVVRPAKIFTVGDTGNGIRTFPAEVKASERSELAFRVNGELKQLPVKAGDHIKQGQLLAQLDQTDFKLRLDDKKAKFDLAESQFKRADTLVKDKLIPVSDFDKAKSNYLAAQADLNLAKKDMDYTTLRAPFDGRISKVEVKNFENVQAKQPILVVQSVDAVDLEFYVPENIIAKVKERPPEERKGVDVRFDQFPDKTYKAIVKEFDTEADPNTQAYRALVTMKMPEDVRVLPGMTATIMADLSKAMDQEGKQLILPVEAVFAAEDKPVDSEERFVWKYDPESQQVSRTAVKVGQMTSDGIVVTAGLAQGEQVIAAGVHFLKEGQKVRPMVRERGL